MTNREFYAFCKAQRRTIADSAKAIAVRDAYQFMWECGVSKAGVHGLIETRIYQANTKGYTEQSKAYAWLREVFDGKGEKRG